MFCMHLKKNTVFQPIFWQVLCIHLSWLLHHDSHLSSLWNKPHRGFSFISVKIFGLYSSDLLPLRSPIWRNEFPEKRRWLHFLTPKQGLGTNKVNMRNLSKCFIEKYLWKHYTGWNLEVWRGNWRNSISKTNSSPQITHLFISFDPI